MNIDYEKVKSTRANAIREYDEYVLENGYITQSEVYSTPVMVAVGYFLKVHSKDPLKEVRRYLKENSLSYRKANEIKMLVDILK